MKKLSRKIENKISDLNKIIFDENNDGLMPRIACSMKNIYNYIKNFILILDKHNIFMLSAGISFNIFLYFIPLILIAIYFAVNLVDTTIIDSTIETFILDFLPHTENTFIIIYEVLTEISAIQKGSSTSGLIGIFTLIWISSLFISAIRSGLDRILEISGDRVFIFYRFKDIYLTLFIPVLIIFYSISIPAFTILINYFADLIPFFHSKTLVEWATDGLSFLFSIVLLFSIYKFIPSKKVSLKFAFISSLIGASLILIAKWIFGWYIVTLSNYGAFYGTYAAIVSIAVWVYYFSFMLLFSAEVGNLIAKKSKDNDSKKK